MSRTACYALRRSPGAENFAAAWDAAIDQARKQAMDIALDRIVHGVEEPVYDRDGNYLYTRRRYNDRLLMYLIGLEHKGVRKAEAVPLETASGAAPANVAHALERLEPITPDAPHEHMPGEELAQFIEDEAANAQAEDEYRRQCEKIAKEKQE